MVRQHHNKEAKKPKKLIGDFVKKTIKVGKKIKRNEVTKLDIKSKRIVVPLQSNVTSVQDTENERAMITMLSRQLHHYNGSSKRAAIDNLKNILLRSNHTESYIALIVPTMLELIFDIEKDTRKDVIQLITALFRRYSSNSFAAITSVLLTYIRSGLTSMSRGVRKDSLTLLSAFAECHSSLLLNHLYKLVEHVLALLSEPTHINGVGANSLSTISQPVVKTALSSNQSTQTLLIKKLEKESREKKKKEWKSKTEKQKTPSMQYGHHQLVKEKSKVTSDKRKSSASSSAAESIPSTEVKPGKSDANSVLLSILRVLRTLLQCGERAHARANEANRGLSSEFLGASTATLSTSTATCKYYENGPYNGAVVLRSRKRCSTWIESLSVHDTNGPCQQVRGGSNTEISSGAAVRDSGFLSPQSSEEQTNGILTCLPTVLAKKVVCRLHTIWMGLQLDSPELRAGTVLTQYEPSANSVLAQY